MININNAQRLKTHVLLLFLRAVISFFVLLCWFRPRCCCCRRHHQHRRRRRLIIIFLSTRNCFPYTFAYTQYLQLLWLSSFWFSFVIVRGHAFNWIYLLFLRTLCAQNKNYMQKKNDMRTSSEAISAHNTERSSSWFLQNAKHAAPQFCTTNESANFANAHTNHDSLVGRENRSSCDTGSH